MSNLYTSRLISSFALRSSVLRRPRATASGRHFGQKKRSNNNTNNSFSLRLVYSDSQFEQKPEPYEIIRFEANSKSEFLKKLEEGGVPVDGPEYYDTKAADWRPVEDIKVLQGKKNVAIREPASYGSESDYDDDYNEDDSDYDDFHGEADGTGSMTENVIREFVDHLKDQGYTLEDGSLLKDGSPTDIRAAMNEYAEEDTNFAAFLLGRVGWADHVENIVKFPFLWKERPATCSDEAEIVEA